MYLLDATTVQSDTATYATYAAQILMNVLSAGSALFDISDANATFVTGFVMLGLLSPVVIKVVRMVFNLI